MEKKEHYKKNLEFFRKSAIYKKGYYDAKSNEKLKHTIWQKRERKIVLALVSNVIKNDHIKTVSDFGCGRGDFTIELANKYSKINFIGGDFSKETLDIAKNESKDIKNIKFKLSNLIKLDFQDKVFDVAICINTLHHIHKEDLDASLSELARVSNRYIILEIKNKNDFYTKYIHRKREFPHYFTTKKHVIKVLAKRGFALKKVRYFFLIENLSPIIILLFKRM